MAKHRKARAENKTQALAFSTRLLMLGGTCASIGAYYFLSQSEQAQERGLVSDTHAGMTTVLETLPSLVVPAFSFLSLLASAHHAGQQNTVRNVAPIVAANFLEHIPLIVANDDKESSLPVSWFEGITTKFRQIITDACAALDYNVAVIIHDTEKAIQHYERAATRGHAQAQLQLGIIYHLGERVPQDEAKAVEWYQKAADQDIDLAQFILGSLYYTGQGVPKDDVKAALFWQKAADQGYITAKVNLGVMYFNGEGVSKDNVKAISLWQQAADQGDADAQFLLGVRYVDGQGVDQDYAKAALLWQQAAAQNHAKAQFFLGVLYFNGQGVPKDEAMAISLWQQAADQNHADALFNLGAIYANGQGVFQDYAKAISFWKKAVDKGHMVAKLMLSHNDLEAFPDGGEIFFWYSKDRLMPKAKFDLDWMSIIGKNQDTKAFAWWQKGADLGYVQAQYRLALSYDEGRGVPKDPVNAKKWYQKAADQGHERALLRIQEMKQEQKDKLNPPFPVRLFHLFNDLLNSAVQLSKQSPVTVKSLLSSYLSSTNAAYVTIENGIVHAGLKIFLNWDQISAERKTYVDDLLERYANNCAPAAVKRNSKNEIISLEFENESVIEGFRQQLTKEPSSKVVFK